MNLCVNSVTFLSHNIAKLKELHQIMSDVASNRTTNSVCELLSKHGYTTTDKMLLCDRRDYISDCDAAISQKLNTYYFSAETCSAWTPNIQSLETLLRERYNGEIRLIAQSEEEGVGIYHTNDVASLFYPEKFKVDCCSKENYDTEYFADWSSMIAFLQGLFPRADIGYYDSIEQIKESIENKYDDGSDDSFFFNLNVFTPYEEENYYDNYQYEREAA